jgi:hypothetical protein
MLSGNKSFAGHEFPPGAFESELYANRRRKEDVDFSSLDLLKISGSQMDLLGQFFLGPTLADALTPHVGTEDLQPGAFSGGQRHGTLRRASRKNENDAMYR